jgi:hypothetical protein
MVDMPTTQQKTNAIKKLTAIEEKKLQDEKNKAYQFEAFCRKCKNTLYSDYFIEVCVCGSERLTVTDRKHNDREDSGTFYLPKKGRE